MVYLRKCVPTRRALKGHEKSGAWFSFDSQRLGQGRENAKAYLKANPEAANRIEAAIRENSGLIAERILDNADPTEVDAGEA